MGILLFSKILMPLLVVSSTFLVVARELKISITTLLVLVLILSNVMAIKMFFEVTSVGSWQVIGTSVSHFGVMNVQVVVVLCLFACARLLVGSAAPDV